MTKEFCLRPEQVAVIYDGVDTDTFRPLEARRQPGTLLYVGNSDDRNKGARYLLEALALLKGRRDLRLTVVDRLVAFVVPTLVRELGLEDRVTLTGAGPGKGFKPAPCSGAQCANNHCAAQTIDWPRLHLETNLRPRVCLHRSPYL